jgi:sporulation protein YqfC
LNMKGNLFQCIMDRFGFEEECVPGHPVVEILGDFRVLVENYHRVTAYEREKIRILVRFGYITITGSNLRLRAMRNSKLLICGQIDRIENERG